MSSTQNVVLTLYSSIKKKLERFDGFWLRLESQILALLWRLPSTPVLKIQEFWGVCWFFGKNLSNFVSPDLLLHNRYYRWILIPQVCDNCFSLKNIGRTGITLIFRGWKTWEVRIMGITGKSLSEILLFCRTCSPQVWARNFDILNF